MKESDPICGCRLFYCAYCNPRANRSLEREVGNNFFILQTEEFWKEKKKNWLLNYSEDHGTLKKNWINTNKNSLAIV